jgi:hypothetical protein
MRRVRVVRLPGRRAWDGSGADSWFVVAYFGSVSMRRPCGQGEAGRRRAESLARWLRRRW